MPFVETSLLSRFLYIVFLSLAWVLATFAFRVPVAAQVFEVSGGTSSLYQAGGGSITMHAPPYNLTLGAGTVGGHIVEGARLFKATPHGTYILGDNRIDFRLPTDLFDASHFIVARGFGYSGVRHDIDIVAFAGGTSTDYSTPFFNSAKITDMASVLFLKKQLNPRWTLYSDTLFAQKFTEIEALQWSLARRVELSFAGGLGANQPFAAISLRMERPRFDLRAEYIAAGKQFRRVTVPSPLFTEPDRGNVLLTVKPLRFLNLTAGHQEFLVPEYPNPENGRSTVDQGTAGVSVLNTQLNATFYHSTYQETIQGIAFGVIDKLPAGSTSNTSGEVYSNHAFAATINRDFWSRFHLGSSYLVSKPKGNASSESLITSVTEGLTSRISATENFNYSNGHAGVTFGGQFLSNFISIGSSYQTFYVPADNNHPFQQALLLDLKVRVFGRLQLHGASFIDPTGHMRYTVDASTVVARNMPSAQPEQVPLGKYTMQGCVVDTDGAPVEGAAILIDDKPVYTDSSGCFFMRENARRTHKLSVMLSEFLIGGNWQITSAPITITSSSDDGTPEPIVVTVRKVRAISATPAVVPPNTQANLK